MSKELADFADYLKSKDIWAWENWCICGGYAVDPAHRSPEHPHHEDCPQYHEWEEQWSLFKESSKSK